MQAWRVREGRKARGEGVSDPVAGSSLLAGPAKARKQSCLWPGHERFSELTPRSFAEKVWRELAGRVIDAGVQMDGM
jgi:hypothetical protein